MSAPGVNFISKFLGAEVVRGRRLKEAAFIVEEKNWIMLKTGHGLFNPILDGGGRGTVESTIINIREYFKYGLQHGFEIFWLLIFIIWGHSLNISDPYLYFCWN